MLSNGGVREGREARPHGKCFQGRDRHTSLDGTLCHAKVFCTTTPYPQDLQTHTHTHTLTHTFSQQLTYLPFHTKIQDRKTGCLHLARYVYACMSMKPAIFSNLNENFYAFSQSVDILQMFYTLCTLMKNLIMEIVQLEQLKILTQLRIINKLEIKMNMK